MEVSRVALKKPDIFGEIEKLKKIYEGDYNFYFINKQLKLR